MLHCYPPLLLLLRHYWVQRVLLPSKSGMPPSDAPSYPTSLNRKGQVAFVLPESEVSCPLAPWDHLKPSSQQVLAQFSA
jgi:hypothetical protein